MKRLRLTYVLLIAALLGASSGCRRESERVDGEPASRDFELLSVGDSALMLSDVVSRIPQGISEADSAAMFASIVDAWVQDMLLTDVAADNLPDLERIERMVADYRNRLIMMEYRKRMKQDARHAPTDDEIRRYYEANADDMRLEHPVIKGIYIKVPSNAERLESVRQWVFSASKASVDKLEKYGLKGAMQYDWFADRWVDWEVIAEQIPYRFYDADAFVESTPNFETEYNGSTYLLHISEYLKSGDVMPYSFAEEVIRDRLAEQSTAEADKRLMQSLFRNAVSSGKLRAPGYDPVNHRLRETVASTTK